ncbi:Asp-tRNA(Asn)/Glu-tRNA(Gln) amidotransferase GatCAB subunit B, partial [Francisella tularensis subsp. holarctica]|nr:Asp-tRNA(Asn)/Glu-tRNA(Gln) amidotransferase GatCAB subunit B [Francisella tularensis subsp. holarctica]
ADYYEKVAVVIGYKPAYYCITVDLISTLNRAEKEFSSDVVHAEILLEIIANVQKDIISQANAKKVISEYIDAPSAIEAIIEKLGLKQV